MSARGVFFAFAIGCTIGSGCAGSSGIPTSAMEARLHYQGFSVERPPNSHWYLYANEQASDRAMFRREDLDSKTHSFFFMVELAQLQTEPKTFEEFQVLAGQNQTSDTARFETKSYNQKPMTVQGQWCVRYESTTIDHAPPPFPGTELVLLIRGVRCKHPTRPAAMVDAWYSERGVASELDPALSTEAEGMILGVRIETAPGVPAA